MLVTPFLQFLVVSTGMDGSARREVLLKFVYPSPCDDTDIGRTHQGLSNAVETVAEMRKTEQLVLPMHATWVHQWVIVEVLSDHILQPKGKSRVNRRKERTYQAVHFVEDIQLSDVLTRKTRYWRS